MNDRGNNGQSGNSSGNSWNKSKDRLGQIEASRQHWWHAA